jgi:polysaccharide biosynthesis/export protein
MIHTRIKPLRTLLVLSQFTLLSACIIVPGSNIDPDQFGAERANNNWLETRESGNGVWFPSFRREQPDTPADQQAARQLVDIVPITPQVVAQQSIANATNPVQAAIPFNVQNEIDNYEYHIDKGDMLHITVYDHPELTNPSGSNNNNIQNSGIIVENDGTIYYPYIGKVQVAGLTVDQIRERIASPLAEFITSPQITVRVIDYNAKRAYVTGQVNEPGPQPITNVPMTILDAIARAGGLSDNANWHDVLLSRNGQDIRLSVYEMLNNGRLGQNMLLQHGDVLHVPVVGQRQVYVLGELNRVNTLPLGNITMSLTEALTRSGGLNQVTSNAEGIFVIRPHGPGADKVATLYQLNVRNAIAFAVGAQFMLEPSDIVYVTTAPVTRWNRVISQIIPSLSALITADRAGTAL